MGKRNLRLARTIARGLRDYAGMAVTERRRRAMAAIDLLRQREAMAAPTPAKAPAPARKEKAAPGKRSALVPTPAVQALPIGHELLEMPVALLAPRARWPKLLAEKLQHLHGA